jgi:hypothetical protein
VACGRRAAKPYYRDGLFLCRLCQDLYYASQGRVLRAAPLRKTQGIRWRLGGSLDIRDPFPPRPKGMHRATHARLHDEYLAALEEHLGGDGRLPRPDRRDDRPVARGPVSRPVGRRTEAGRHAGASPERRKERLGICGRSGARFPLTDMLCMYDRSDRVVGAITKAAPRR